MEAIIQLPHPSTYMLDVLNNGFNHANSDEYINIRFTKDELEYLIKCVEEKRMIKEIKYTSENLFDIKKIKT